MTQRPDGQWRALTNEELHHQKIFIGQIYRNYLAQELTALGLAVESRPKGLFELKGMPQELLDAFSARSQEIKKMLPELQEKYPTLSDAELKAIAAQNSRAPKVKLSEEKLQEHWQQKLSELGIDKEQLSRDLFNQQRPQLKQVNHADMALKVLTQDEAVVKREDILASALKYSIGEKTIEDAEADLTTAKTSVKMDEDLYSTRDMVTLEDQLAKYLKTTADSQTPLLAKQRFMLLPKDKVLTADQEHALQHTLSSRDKVTALQGDAGTGKSQLATVIARNYRRRGYDIRPLSPTALAARGLQEKGLTTATTIDRFLNGRSGHYGRSRLFIVEESSQLGSRKLKEILDRTHTSDRVLMIGDRNQHQSIDAGAIFHKAQQHSLISTNRLQENVRQKVGPAFLRHAVSHLAEHQVEEAFTLLDKHQRIREISDNEERLNIIVESYAAATPDKAPMVITGTNAERQLLNEMIRERLVADGKISADGKTVTVNQPKYLKLGERNLSHEYQKGDTFFLNQTAGKLAKGTRGQITAVDHINNTLTIRTAGDGRAKKATINLAEHGHLLSTYTQKALTFAKGDKVVFLKNDEAQGLQNGLAGTVEEVKEDGTMRVNTSDDRLLTINTSEYGFLDYGYSTTSFKVQGSEHARVIYHADTRHYNRFQNFYVATSRAREDIEILTDNKDRLQAQVQEQEMKTSTLDYTVEDSALQQGMGLDLSISDENSEV